MTGHAGADPIVDPAPREPWQQLVTAGVARTLLELTPPETWGKYAPHATPAVAADVADKLIEHLELLASVVTNAAAAGEPPDPERFVLNLTNNHPDAFQILASLSLAQILAPAYEAANGG